MPEPNPPPQAVTTLTQMQKTVHFIQFVVQKQQYANGGTVCTALTPPGCAHSYLPRAEDPGPLPSRTPLSYRPLGGPSP